MDGGRRRDGGRGDLDRAGRPGRGPAAPPAPTQPTVGDTARPLNVEGAPQFGWMPGSAKGDDVQTAYEIQLSDAAGQPVWVASSDQSYVAYAGPALDKGASCTWNRPHLAP